MKYLPIGEILILSGVSYAGWRLADPFLGKPFHGTAFFLGIAILAFGLFMRRCRRA
jgi:hypothetical protein